MLTAVGFVNSLFIKIYRVSSRVLVKNNDRFYVGYKLICKTFVKKKKKEQKYHPG